MAAIELIGLLEAELNEIALKLGFTRRYDAKEGALAPVQPSLEVIPVGLALEAFDCPANVLNGVIIAGANLGQSTTGCGYDLHDRESGAAARLCQGDSRA